MDLYKERCVYFVLGYLKKNNKIIIIIVIINNCLLYLGDKNMEIRLRDIERKMEFMKEKLGED